MTWRDRVASWFRPVARLSMPDAAWSMRAPFAFDAGSLVTSDTAQQVGAVFGCISRIANAIAPHPWKVYEVNGRRREYRPDDPISWLLNKRPNPATTALAFRQALLRGCMAGNGNAYAEIQFDGAGRPMALWPLEPDRVEPHTDVNGVMFYRIQQYTGETVDVEARRIFHLRGFASVNGLVGDGVVSRASRAIAIAQSAQQYAASYFANGTISSGVLKHPKRVDPKAVARLRQEWLENHSGPGAAHKPLFLEDGMDWQSITVDAEKSQLHETRAFAVEEIARYFGVPLHLLGVAQSAQGYGTNVEQLGIEFVRYTLEAWTAALEQEADFKLFPMRAPWRETKIDLSKLRQGDAKTQAEADVILKKGGILSTNEIREARGLNTVGDDGDVFVVESTLKTVEQLLNPPEPAPALPAPKAEPEDDPAEEADEPDEMPMQRDKTRAAVALVVASALDRYHRVLKNRRADLERQAPEKVEENIAAERDRQRERLREECVEALTILGGAAVFPLGLIAEAVEEGEPPRAAAARLIGMVP